MSAAHAAAEYLAISLILPLLWLLSVALARGYDPRFIGVGSDEFRKVVNAGVCLYGGRRRLGLRNESRHRTRLRGHSAAVRHSVRPPCQVCTPQAPAQMARPGSLPPEGGGVGHADVAAKLAVELGCATYHGLSVVAACVAGRPDASLLTEIAGVPAMVGFDRVAEVVEAFGADTVAVLACPEMSGVRLRELAWELEKTDTDLCVAPALLDVAGSTHHDQARRGPAAAAYGPSRIHGSTSTHQDGVRPGLSPQRRW